MKKIISLIVIMGILLFVLTGCVNIEYDLTLKEDGSADIAFIYGFEKEMISEIETSSEELCEDIKTTATDAGYTVENYSDEKIEGIKATKHVDNASNISLFEIFDGINLEQSEEDKIKIEKKNLKTVFSQNGEIDLTTMDETSANMSTIVYKINLPVKAEKSNATETSEDGKTLTWKLKGGENNKIEFEAVKEDGKIIIIISIVLIIIIALIIIICIIKSRKKEENIETQDDDTDDSEENASVE